MAKGAMRGSDPTNTFTGPHMHIDAYALMCIKSRMLINFWKDGWRRGAR
jgi:hypothetical protein